MAGTRPAVDGDAPSHATRRLSLPHPSPEHHHVDPDCTCPPTFHLSSSDATPVQASGLSSAKPTRTNELVDLAHQPQTPDAPMNGPLGSSTTPPHRNADDSSSDWPMSDTSYLADESFPGVPPVPDPPLAHQSAQPTTQPADTPSRNTTTLTQPHKPSPAREAKRGTFKPSPSPAQVARATGAAGAAGGSTQASKAGEGSGTTRTKRNPPPIARYAASTRASAARAASTASNASNPETSEPPAAARPTAQMSTSAKASTTKPAPPTKSATTNTKLRPRMTTGVARIGSTATTSSVEPKAAAAAPQPQAQAPPTTVTTGPTGPALNRRATLGGGTYYVGY